MGLRGREVTSTKTILAIILIVVILIGGVLALLQFTGTANTLAIFGYESVYKAFYGHICCEEGAFEPPYIKYADDKTTYKCDGYTDECRLNLIFDNKPIGVYGRACYEINGVSKSKQWDDETGFILKYGDEITFKKCSLDIKDSRGYYKFSAKFRKFYIQGQENGKVFVSKSCILNSDLKQRVLAGGLNELSKTGVNRCQNYITDYILVETKTYEYQRKEVLCQARTIYEIDNIDLIDGSSKKIQGNQIKSVECCPTEANCDDDFKFKEDVIKECNYDYECPNAGDPVAETGTSYVKYDCKNNQCVQSNPINVQCTNNAICVALYNKPNMVCKNWRCTEDDVWIGHCGDGKCESVIGETAFSCPDDCAEAPEDFNMNWLFLLPVLLTLGMSSLLGYRGKLKNGEYNWVDFVIGAVFGIIIGLIALWVVNHWILIILIGLIGVGGSLGLILILGGLPLLIFLINFMRGDR